MAISYKPVTPEDLKDFMNNSFIRLCCGHRGRELRWYPQNNEMREFVLLSLKDFGADEKFRQYDTLQEALDAYNWGPDKVGMVLPR